jgi:hypothetical protein
MCRGSGAFWVIEPFAKHLHNLVLQFLPVARGIIMLLDNVPPPRGDDLLRVENLAVGAISISTPCIQAGRSVTDRRCINEKGMVRS